MSILMREINEQIAAIALIFAIIALLPASMDMLISMPDYAFVKYVIGDPLRHFAIFIIMQIASLFVFIYMYNVGRETMLAPVMRVVSIAIAIPCTALIFACACITCVIGISAPLYGNQESVNIRPSKHGL